MPVPTDRLPLLLVATMVPMVPPLPLAMVVQTETMSAVGLLVLLLRRQVEARMVQRCLLT